MNSHVTTIERFILDQEDRYPEATGELSNLLYDICLAAKIIAASIRRAGLVNILGTAGIQNVQGEEQQAELGEQGQVRPAQGRAGVRLTGARIEVVQLVPPSTAISCPEMYDAASESRNAAAWV